MGWVIWAFVYLLIGACWTANDFAQEHNWDPADDFGDRLFVAACIVGWTVRLAVNVLWGLFLWVLWACNFFAKERTYGEG